MLQSRETDLPALFLVLVVLPLVAYILLGKWSESSKKKERIRVLAQIAAEEAFRAEAMVATTVIPVVPLSISGVHECARCYGPATTRCSRCKSVRYCSGKCQIIHWRQIHKQDCQLLEYNSSSASPKSAFNEEFIHENFLFDENTDFQYFESNIEHPGHEKAPSDEPLHPPVSMGASATDDCMIEDASGLMMERKLTDQGGSRRSKGEMLRGEERAVSEASGHQANCTTSYDNTPSKETFIRHKFKQSHPVLSKEEILEKTNVNIPAWPTNGCATKHDRFKSSSPNESAFDLRMKCGISSSLKSSQSRTNACDTERELVDGESFLRGGIASSNEAAETECSSGRSSTRRSNATKMSAHSPGTKMHKSAKLTSKVSRDQSCSDMERKGHIMDDDSSRCLEFTRMRDNNPAQGGDGVASMGFMKMIGLKKSLKHDRLESMDGYRHKKIKVLFPYDEFVKFFQHDVFDLLPRGLVNCGNSCYANAVLQCLPCTKPLTIYLLRRSHSRACCVKDWGLMCELEQHVMMVRESGGPLSLSRILLHMRNANCQIGDGSQEDAHEFLRLIVTSMQSICLEGLGGEDVVDPRLQETTFVLHTFRGHLRSKVKCLRCHDESERYENFMDLTLEIFGWVESLEDALTQFTSPEDLDGENMYRCGRCAAYVRAQKQFGIEEAPNILTIVLKRFQEGNYGKINKCITFPDMLDMIPYMTGTDDIPPLYMLYAVVVHLDTMNASFSGHYVSYVKDLQGNWFRIDDTQVQPVPMSQVMSEGAYILFYTRSCPRPARAAYTQKPARHEVPAFTKHSTSKAPKSYSDHRHETREIHKSSNRNRPPTRETYAKPSSRDFSDAATSSDWSIFTSSDDASFTTDSTRDSFSTIDYADACNIVDPISSIFNTTSYTPDYSSHKTVSCSRFSGSGTQTRFVPDGKDKGSVLCSHFSGQPPYKLLKGQSTKHVKVVSSTEAFPSGSHCGVYVKYEKDGRHRTSGQCTL